MGNFIYTTALDKIRRMKKRIKVIPGGSSAGKTYSILPILIDKAITNKGLSISIVSESMPHLRRGAMRDFLKIMKDTNRYIDEHWNRSNSIYNFGNGSYIEFFSVDDDSKLRGARRNVLYINECNNVKREAYTQLAMRTDMDIYLDYNPSHRFWVEEVKDSIESEVLVLTYKDNEALSQNVIDFLEERRELAKTSDYWDNWWKVYGLGQQGTLDGVIFNNWEIIDYLPKDECRLLGYGMDFGFTNDPTTMVGLYKWNNDIIVDEIIYEKGLLNSEIANRIKSLNIEGDIYADSAEPKSIRELRSYGLRVMPCVKGKDSIISGINLLQEYKIYITRSSNNLIEEFQRYSWKENRDGNKENVPIDNWNHGIDALRYIGSQKLKSSSKYYNPILSNDIDIRPNSYFSM